MLFSHTTCESDFEDPEFMEIDKLSRTELFNFDFSGTELKEVDEKAPKQAYVIGVKCFGDTYEYSTIDSTEILLKENIYIKNANSLRNVEPDFNIITLNDFDENHKAGSSVTDCFKMSHDLGKDLSYTLVLRKYPISGLHAFKLIYQIKESKSTIESTTTEIELL